MKVSLKIQKIKNRTKKLRWPIILLACLSWQGFCMDWVSRCEAVEQSNEPVTFSNAIAEIVYAKCVSCHRQGQSGPFQLLTYEDVSKHAETMIDVVNRRYMPPWKPDPKGLHYQNDRRLNDDEIAKINAWVKAGCPEGERGKIPKPPQFPDGWSLGKPDMVLKMDQAFDIPADGPDLYRSFVFKVDAPEDKWIKAIELRPTARPAVHHALFFVDTTGKVRSVLEKDGKPGIKGMNFFRGIGANGNGFSKMSDSVARGLGGYVPGATPNRLPGDLARYLPKGSDIIMQTHFHPSGKPEREQAELGLYFAEKPPKQKLVPIQIPGLFGIGAGIDVPAGEANFKIHESFTLPIAVKAFEIGGHAHYICKSMKMIAKLPNGETIPLLKIDDWDLDWQDQYQFQNEIELPEGTVLDVEIIYDNSKDNPENPYSPPQRIAWGRESNDEMGSITMTVVAKNESERIKLEEATRKNAIAAIRNRIQNQSGRMNQGLRGRAGLGNGALGNGGIGNGALGNGTMLKLLDRNRDGSLDAEEIPEAVRSRLLEFLDEDGNDRLDPKELEAGRKNIQEIMKPEKETGIYHGLEFRDIDGRMQGVPQLAGKGALVAVFGSTTCPIANAYQPELRRLYEKFASDGIQWVMIHPDASLSDATVRKHKMEFNIPFPVVIDSDQSLVKDLQATVTPEVFVVDADGQLRYQGRIDDRYPELGKKKAIASSHDLERALDQLVAGESILVAKTEAVGCKIRKVP